MRLLLPGFFLFFCLAVGLNGSGQDLPLKKTVNYDKPLFGEQLMLVSQDTLLAYFNLFTDRLQDRACATAYRIGPIDQFFQFDGVVRDYYTSNNAIASDLIYKKGYLDGVCTYYYADGKILEKGTYNRNKRTGQWDYYFPDGQKEKTIQFTEGGYFLTDCFDRDGKMLTSAGNGRFEGVVSVNTLANPLKYLLKGAVKNGVPEGEWTLSNLQSDSVEFRENFSSGGFLKGISYSKLVGDKEYHQTALSNFESIHPMEHLNYYGQVWGCGKQGLLLSETMGRGTVEDNLFDKKDGKITRLFRAGKYPKFSGWILIDISYDNKGTPVGTQVLLNQPDDALAADITKLLKKTYKDNESLHQKGGKDLPEEKFFIVLVGDNQIVLPTKVMLNAINGRH